MAYASHTSERIGVLVLVYRILVFGVPRCVRSVDYGARRLVNGVVPQQRRVAVGNGHVIVSDVHSPRVVRLIKRDVDFLGVTHKRYGGVRGTVRLVREHLDRLHQHAVPQRIERQAVVDDVVSVGAAARGTVELYAQLGHVIALGHVSAHEAGAAVGKHVGIGALAGKGYELVFARIERRDVHSVGLVLQGSHPVGVALLLGHYEFAVFVERIERHRAYVVVEHVGALKVVVILEGDIQAVSTVAEVFLHHVTRSERGGREQCAAQPSERSFY